MLCPITEWSQPVSNKRTHLPSTQSNLQISFTSTFIFRWRIWNLGFSSIVNVKFPFRHVFVPVSAVQYFCLAFGQFSTQCPTSLQYRQVSLLTTFAEPTECSTGALRRLTELSLGWFIPKCRRWHLYRIPNLNYLMLEWLALKVLDVPHPGSFSSLRVVFPFLFNRLLPSQIQILRPNYAPSSLLYDLKYSRSCRLILSRSIASKWFATRNASSIVEGSWIKINFRNFRSFNESTNTSRRYSFEKSDSAVFPKTNVFKRQNLETNAARTHPGLRRRFFNSARKRSIWFSLPNRDFNNWIISQSLAPGPISLTTKTSSLNQRILKLEKFVFFIQPKYSEQFSYLDKMFPKSDLPLNVPRLLKPASIGNRKRLSITFSGSTSTGTGTLLSHQTRTQIRISKNATSLIHLPI